MPEKTPLKPVIHGRIDKPEYTIEKVYFQSFPGHYVTGNLYRPKGRSGRLPAVLSPHGHWANGRFYDAGEAAAKDQIQQKAESFMPNARYPLQARMATLARLGCVVFHYDMVGNADSKAISHSQGFTDVDAILRLQSFMGLQTWNSVRALDFLAGLPDVDPKRIGVTGASGGGTQTFILCAIDDRPAAAFPAVMVSTAMQGGCVCENCPLLRIGSTNIEFAAMFAPKPYGMTGADDWTKEIETKGLPELKKHFALFGAADKVTAKALLQFKHNYNEPSRKLMYEWFNQHLNLGHNSVAEREIPAVEPKALSVFDDKHPAPSDAKNATALRKYLTEVSDRQQAELQPTDAHKLARYREVVGAALRAMVVDQMPELGTVQVREVGRQHGQGYVAHRLLLSRRQSTLFPTESVPAVAFLPDRWLGRMVVWADREGRAGLTVASSGLPNPDLRRLFDLGIAVLTPDVFLTGEYHRGALLTPPPVVNTTYPGYTFCYNRTVLANRVHDMLTAIGCARDLYGASEIDLVGTGEAGLWTILAKALVGNVVNRTVVDLEGFSFRKITSADDPTLLPGGLKYGDVIGLVRLCAPDFLTVRDADRYPADVLNSLRHTYEVAGAVERLTLLNRKSGTARSPVDLLANAK
jgi:dienelactone hydrolase